MTSWFDTINAQPLMSPGEVLNENKSFTISHDCKIPVTGQLSIVKVSGPQAGELLQGQLSANIQSLEQGQSTMACFCNPQGRVRAFINVMFDGQDYYICTPASNCEFLTAELGKYAVFYQLTIEVLDVAMMGLILTGTDATQGQQHPLMMGKGDNTTKALAFTFNEQFLLFFSDHESIKCLWDSMDKSVIGCDFSLWAMGLNQWKIPEIGQEQSEHFLPHHINCIDLGAVDFKKGCYTGQEIVARMQYRGQIKKHLHRVRYEGALLPPKTGILDAEKNVGELVNSMKVNDKYNIALAVIQEQALTKDLALKEENRPILELIQ